MAVWQIDPHKRETANRVAFSPTGYNCSFLARAGENVCAYVQR